MSQRYGLQIRAVIATDAPGLAELAGACGCPIDASALEVRIDALRRQPGVALVALEWGPPSGLVVLAWLRTLASDVPTAHVTALLVGPQERRRGIGRLLLKAAAQAARQAGCGALQLCARADDPSTRGFCAANGFSEGGSLYTRPLRKRP